jgi:hypothetical protein
LSQVQWKPYGLHCLPVSSVDPRAGHEEDPFVVPCDALHGKRRGRIRHVGDDVDLVGIDPTAGQVRGDVGLVLVVTGDDLDRRVGHFVAKLLGRQPGRHDRAFAIDVGIDARAIGQHANFDEVVGKLGVRRTRSESRQGDAGEKDGAHVSYAFRLNTSCILAVNS